MAAVTYEGIVENGMIRLSEDVTLPEHAKVYVVVPGVEAVQRASVASPRLAHPEQAADFAKQIVQRPADAGV